MNIEELKDNGIDLGTNDILAVDEDAVLERFEYYREAETDEDEAVLRFEREIAPIFREAERRTVEKFRELLHEAASEPRFPRVNQTCRKMMEERGWSLEGTAAALNISPETLQSHLDGRSSWHVLEFARLCKLAGANADELLSEEA